MFQAQIRRGDALLHRLYAFHTLRDARRGGRLRPRTHAMLCTLCACTVPHQGHEVPLQAAVISENCGSNFVRMYPARRDSPANRAQGCGWHIIALRDDAAAHSPRWQHREAQNRL